MTLRTASGQAVSSATHYILDEKSFQRMICLERKRTERSRKPLLLMLVDSGTSCQATGRGRSPIISILSATTRETDITGWHKDGSVVGVMFTEINIEDKAGVQAVLLARLTTALRNELSLEEFSQIKISFHIFPEDGNGVSEHGPRNLMFYPDQQGQHESRRSMRLMKRAVDIIGSVVALVVLFPLLLVIAIAIRVSSKGPILFRQPRVGHHCVPFDVLKFRTMYANSDPRIHQEYVTKLVAGTAKKQPTNGNAQGVYKLTSDPRVTRLGGFLRRTSLDELPQFVNVLKGDMSLVGPRPPLWYEVEAYDLWHRRRLLEAKPGITGLWQVSGRNRIKFDDMVRLDLRYARTCSLWLDLKILLRTPLAVVEGAH